jgi:hypothetical protein
VPGIAAYIIASHDDTDVCVNAVRSAARFCEEILLVDTGKAALTAGNDKLQLPTVREFQSMMCDEGLPVTYTSVDWSLESSLSVARNLAGELLSGYDWIWAVDSDEFATDQLVQRLTDLPHELGPDVVTVAPNNLALYPDERHYSKSLTGPLTHGRLYRPRVITWSNRWHEHQNYNGRKIEIPFYQVHCRQLFTNRCMRQRGHYAEAWKGIADDVREVGELGVTWPSFVYPEEDRATN